MASIPLQQSIVYGPVFSRRLGRSFGINLLPSNRKVCSFDCIYCEYGKTSTPTLNPPPEIFLPKSEVLCAVERLLSKPRTIQYLTFSGNGEPTLHPDFYEIVKGIKAILRKDRPEVKLALFTNGSKSNQEEVRSAYQIIDRVMIKLDAGDGETFKKINRPAIGFTYSELIEGLKRIPGLALQSCLIDGTVTNIRGDAYCTWARMLETLKPEEVHIYSIERPTSERSVRRVAPETLEIIKRKLQARHGLNIKVFWCQ